MPFMFENLTVYQKAVDLIDQITTLTEQFPRGYYYLTDQLNRAALSIATNLAEGNGRKECFGYVRTGVKLEAGKTYLLEVRFRVEGFEDVNRHLVHGFFGAGFNNGVFKYRKDGKWVVGRHRFKGPAKALGGDAGAVGDA